MRTAPCQPELTPSAGRRWRQHTGARVCSSPSSRPRQSSAARGAQARRGLHPSRPPPSPIPSPAHPSSAMALSVGAAPARLPAANTDTNRRHECRRPPRSPRPAPPARDARPAAGMEPGRPRRRQRRAHAHPPPPTAARRRGGGASASRSYSGRGPRRARGRGLPAAVPDEK